MRAFYMVTLLICNEQMAMINFLKSVMIPFFSSGVGSHISIEDVSLAQ